MKVKLLYYSLGKERSRLVMEAQPAIKRMQKILPSLQLGDEIVLTHGQTELARWDYFKYLELSECTTNS